MAFWAKVNYTVDGEGEDFPILIEAIKREPDRADVEIKNVTPKKLKETGKSRIQVKGRFRIGY